MLRTPMSVEAAATAPLLTIVTVCRNSARTIAETLASVDPFLEDFRVLEHLIVDGCSTDGTLELVSRAIRPGRKLVSEPDTGLYDAMNKGLRQARGEYVWFLNSDDYLHPALIAAWPNMLSVLQKRRPPVLIGEIEMFKETPTGIAPTRYWRVPKDVAQARRFGWHPPHPAFIAKRELLAALGGFDQSKRIAADFKLMTQAMAGTAGKAAAVFAHPLVAMREGGVSNGSVGSILVANRECYASLRELGTPALLAAAGICAKLARKVGQKFISGREPVRRQT
jgi:glycosyltransferase